MFNLIENKENISELAKKIKEKKVILFVGAGVSASLNFPTYRKLMDHLAEDLDIDKDLFSLYGDYLQQAEYYKLEKKSLAELKDWTDKNWIVDDKAIKESKIYKYILRLNIPIIYTTNFDRYIEKAYELNGRKYIKINKVEDLCKKCTDETQIVKFHGDFDDIGSIVFTESSYFDRLDFESPLDIKLRADSLGKSLLFIGYSLSDINMKYMLYKLNKLWAAYNKSLPPKSYIFMAKPNIVEERVFKSRNILTIAGTKNNLNESLENFLSDLCEEVEK